MWFPQNSTDLFFVCGTRWFESSYGKINAKILKNVRERENNEMVQVVPDTGIYFKAKVIKKKMLFTQEKVNRAME